MPWTPSPRGKTGLALVIANFDGIHELKALPSYEGIDTFCYTDAATVAACPPQVGATWTRLVVPNYPRDDFSPRLRAAISNIRSTHLDETRDARWLIWADSTLQFHDLRFLHEKAAALARLPERKRVLFVPHPDRRTIWEEYRFIQDLIDQGHEYLTLRYADEKMTEQMDYFRSRSWDLQPMLWCGTFWMMGRSELMCRAWYAWWDQNVGFGVMDQLSLPIILAAHGIDPQALPVHLWKNDLFSWVQHARSI